MKVIILAAGKGSRFEDHPGPKTLLSLANGMTVLGQQLENIAQYIHLDHVMIVVGYQKEQIQERYSNLNFVENPNYATTNTSKSLLLALDQIEKDDVLWLNGDVVFHPSVLHRLVAFDKTAMVVNTDQVEEEEIKYMTDGVGRITQISKTFPDPEQAKGEALGINLFKADHIEALKKHLEKCAPDDYFEQGVQNCIDDGIEVLTVPVENTSAVEIDFPEDLDKANSLIERWEQGRI